MEVQELLPIADDNNIVSLSEGWTPLTQSKRIYAHYGLKRLFLKDETRLPTGSLKDRCATVSISKAVEDGVKAVVVSSSGNGASSMAAYSARAGIECYVFVPPTAAENKLIQSMAYGAKVVKVKGVQGNSDRMASKVAQKNGWPNVSTAATFNPYAMQGQKTAAYEILEQLGWEVPDWIVLPVGSGNCLAGQWAGFNDFSRIGLIKKKPKLAAVQSTGCAPFTDAVRNHLNVSEVKPWKNPNTIAGGVRDEYPHDLQLALPSLRESSGAAVSVTDQEILETVRLLARDEGMFVEATGAVTTAGLKHLVEEKIIDKDETVVAMLTGSGLKDPQHIGSILEKPRVIDPSIDSVAQLFQ
jgi:threonine synthase